MTGTELAKIVKNEWPDIPVLLATGYADRVGDEIGLPKVRSHSCSATSLRRSAYKPAAPKAGARCLVAPPIWPNSLVAEFFDHRFGIVAN